MPDGKSIVLFSDGTGNSSAQLLKTNVWRTYEAVDLGPATPGKRKQIAYYDDGIGTSSFRPRAMLAGMLGIGLKRNILDIYRFACRNYQPGDDIYGFGFSRGAFTIRLVIAMIASQGLVPSTTEAELMARSADAYRRFRSEFEPRLVKRPTRLLRSLRDRVIAWRRARQESEAFTTLHPRIAFVGVWDTVAAYGGPIVEVVRAIDNWFYALSMPDYHLNERVQCARHALALDDMRDAFQPLVWDELHERKLIDEGKVAAERMQQVWFTGMHADVGGGYPDESLSYVSLLWILEEAEKAGLRTLTVITDRFRALASSSGPIHDSRAGLGSYYRYQPRRLAGLLDPPSAEWRINWDPSLSTEHGQRRGLLTKVAVHESVAARIASGNDRYAPITLPQTFVIVPPQLEGETAPQSDNQSGEVSDEPKQPIPMLSAAVRLGMTDKGTSKRRDAAMNVVWDLVWLRRVTYFVSLAITLGLLLLPLLPDRRAADGLCGDDRCLLPGLFGAIGAFLPDLAEPWLAAFGRNPLIVVILLFSLLAFYSISRRIEAATHARAYAAWRGQTPAPSKNPLVLLARRVRCNPAYQTFFHRLKWFFLPFLVAVLLLAVATWLGGALLTQTWLVFAERNGTFCKPVLGKPVSPITFRTDALCTDLHQDVFANQQVEIVLRPRKPWTDAGYRSAPDVGVVDGLPLYAAPLGLYRRVVGADWMKPLIAVHGVGSSPGQTSALRVERLDFALQHDGSYIAKYQATTDGRLYLMVNDSVLPFLPHVFYRNNTGEAAVAVRPTTIEAQLHKSLEPGQQGGSRRLQPATSRSTARAS